MLRTKPSAVMARLALLERQTTPIGSLTLAVQVDPSRAQALVTASLAEHMISRHVLTLTAPTMRLDVVSGNMSATGTLTMTIAAPPQYSNVAAAVRVTSGDTQIPFSGDIASWIATNAPIVAEFDFLISAVLSAHTTVRGLDGAIANLDFVSGSETLGGATVTQAAPVQVLAEIIDGAVHIAAGASIRLTIPTALEKGFLFLSASFPNEPAGSNRIASVVALWALP